MAPKAVLAGGTGFIGAYLKQRFQEDGYQVVIVSRQAGHVPWHDTPALVEALNGADLLVNLAGRSVNCRYHARNRREILTSRTETTRTLGSALQQCSQPPPLWLNSSTATIYRHAEDRPMTETDGEIGEGFSVDVARAWEDAFFAWQLPHTRQVALRIAIVLGPGGGVMTPFRRMVRFGLGGAQGSGRQMFSWLHVEDLYQQIRFVQANRHIDGVVNCSAPQPVTNAELMKLLRWQLGVPVGLPSPAWLLAIGAVFIGTETELILKSRWVLPERLQRLGYQFRYPALPQALAHILR